MSKEEEILENNQAMPEAEEGNQELNDIKSRSFKYVGVLAVILALAWYFYNDTEQSQIDSVEASILMERIMPYFEKGDYLKALEGDNSIMINNEPLMGLREVSEKFSGSETSMLAAMYSGNAYKYMGDVLAAKTWYEKAVNSSSKIVKIGALTGLAYCQEAEGDYGSAAENYKKASKLVDSDELINKYGYFSGLCLEKAGKVEKAKAQYLALINNDTQERESEFITKAKQGLVGLGTKIE